MNVINFHSNNQGFPGKLSGELTQIRFDITILLCTSLNETISDQKIDTLDIKIILMKLIVMKNHAQKIREVLNGAKGKTQVLLSYSSPSPDFQVSRISIVTLSILGKKYFCFATGIFL